MFFEIWVLWGDAGFFALFASGRLSCLLLGETAKTDVTASDFFWPEASGNSFDDDFEHDF